MPDESFDTQYWEAFWAAEPIPQEVDCRVEHEFHRIFTSMLPRGPLRLLEVGCAPGRWLAYFHRHFGYHVSGVEYAPMAHRKTIENLECLGVPHEIFLDDFFRFEHAPFDLVYSAGFIEHYRDPAPVVDRLASLCRDQGGYVITVVPNLTGLNRWIARTFRPKVAAGHFPTRRRMLRRLHERAGLTTCYCSYVGTFYVLAPVDRNEFAARHPRLSARINQPILYWNRAIDILTARSGVYPKWGGIAKSLVYIGQKR